MRKEYNIASLNPRRNPYYRKLREQAAVRIWPEVIAYFMAEARSTGIPYQTLINMYLKDCADKKKKLNIERK